MLAIGRALMNSQVDVAGRAFAWSEPSISSRTGRVLVQINREANIPIILVEQNASMALRVAHRGYVMEVGKIIVDGSREDLLQNRS
jgi:branched-chain amino acid transport system ATP-binding protein